MKNYNILLIMSLMLFLSCIEKKKNISQGEIDYPGGEFVLLEPVRAKNIFI